MVGLNSEYGCNGIFAGIRSTAVFRSFSVSNTIVIWVTNSYESVFRSHSSDIVINCGWSQVNMGFQNDGIFCLPSLTGAQHTAPVMVVVWSIRILNWNSTVKVTFTFQVHTFLSNY